MFAFDRFVLRVLRATFEYNGEQNICIDINKRVTATQRTKIGFPLHFLSGKLFVVWFNANELIFLRSFVWRKRGLYTGYYVFMCVI